MTRQPQRRAFVVGVRPDKREEYLTLHRAVWPGVERKLTECNVRNYSIFIFGDILFAYYEYVGKDHEADMRRIAEERDPGALWQPIEEVWHLA